MHAFILFLAAYVDVVGVNDRVIIVRASNLQHGSKVVNQAPEGSIYAVEEINGDWIKFKAFAGWCPKANVMSLADGQAHYANIIEREPGNGSAHYLLGECLSKSARPNTDALKRAREHYTTCFRLQPTHLGAIFSRAEVNEKLRDFDAAIKDYSNVLHAKRTPATPYFHIRRGSVFATIGDFGNALEDYELAVKESNGHPEFVKVRDAMKASKTKYESDLQDGIDLLEEGNLRFAKVALEAVAVEFSQMGEPWYHLARVAQKKGEHDYAFRCTVTALHLYVPEQLQPEVFRLRAEYCFAKRYFDRALEAVDEALALAENDASLHALRGAIAADSEASAVAASAYTRAIQLAPDNLDYRKRRAFVWESLGRRELQIADLRFVCDRNPELLGPGSMLAIALAKNNQFDEALDIVSAWKEDNGNLSRIGAITVSDYLYQKAMHALAEGNAEDSIAAHKEALSIWKELKAPRNARSIQRHNWGIALSLLTKDSPSQQDVSRAIFHASTACGATAWSNHDFCNTLSLAYIVTGNPEHAEAVQQKYANRAQYRVNGGFSPPHDLFAPPRSLQLD